jgi:hypothetical protein
MFSLQRKFQTSSGAHISSYSMGTCGLFFRVYSGQGREADYAFLSSAKVKNGAAIPPLPSIPS